MTSIHSSFYSKVYTATADTPFHVEDDSSIILTSINIHCYSNDCYYGNAACLSGIIRANAIVWFDSPCKPSELLFKNLTAGSNCQIVITGTMEVKK
jgi:hypothetical protein